VNQDLSKALNEKSRKVFPALNLTPEDMCRISMLTLTTLAAHLRRRTTFSGARLLKYAGKSVEDFLTGKEK
jgi:hypothetical protein